MGEVKSTSAHNVVLRKGVPGVEHDALLAVAVRYIPQLIETELQSFDYLWRKVSEIAVTANWTRLIDEAIAAGRIPEADQQLLWREAHATEMNTSDMPHIEECETSQGRSFYRYVDVAGKSLAIPQLLATVDLEFEFGVALSPEVVFKLVPAAHYQWDDADDNGHGAPYLSKPSEAFVLRGELQGYPATLYAEVFPSSAHAKDVMERMAQLEEAASIDSVRAPGDVAKRPVLMVVTVSNDVFSAAVNSRHCALLITEANLLHDFEPAQCVFQFGSEQSFEL